MTEQVVEHLSPKATIGSRVGSNQTATHPCLIFPKNTGGLNGSAQHLLEAYRRAF